MDGAICAEVLEKSQTIVLRLLRSGKLSGFRGNKKKILEMLVSCGQTLFLIFLFSPFLISILKMSGEACFRCWHHALTSKADLRRGQPWVGKCFTFFLASCLFLQNQTHVQGLLVNLSHFALFRLELNQHGLYIQESFLCGAPFSFLKGTGGGKRPFCSSSGLHHLCMPSHTKQL